MTELEGGRFSEPVHVGDEIHRRPMQDNSEVHRLLQHFESVDCPLTPRFLGMTADGLERLSYLPGVTGYPPLTEELRSDEALVSVASAVRRVHDAARGFVPSPGAQWNGYELARPATIDCIGHHDLAPWNFVFAGTDVTGIIDWDSAGPSNRSWDLAYAAYQFVPFHPAEDLVAWGWPSEPDRRARMQLFLDAYGEGVSSADLVDAAVTRVYSIGAFIDREVRRQNPAYAVHAREGHAAGYFRAAASLMSIRGSLV